MTLADKKIGKICERAPPIEPMEPFLDWLNKHTIKDEETD